MGSTRNVKACLTGRTQAQDGQTNTVRGGPVCLGLLNLAAN